MRFMIIERFDPEQARAIYERARERGRLLPEGLSYVDSWVSPDLDRCFQLMDCDDPELIGRWTDRWADLVRFEIFPVISSDQAAALVFADDGTPEER